jgi:membrane-bound serine protease (ClpP class)
MRRALAACLLFLLATALALPAVAQAPDPTQTKPVTVLEAQLQASISLAQADMLDEALEKAGALGADVLLLRLDTPGGSITTMRRMVASILNAKIPVVLWVAPSGARAASAGVFLMAAATVSAMAPQTTIGSASPIGPGGQELDKTAAKKTQNDLESLLRGVTALRGRNIAWFRSAVTEASNLTADEAVRERVVDYIAVSREDLFAQIGRRGLPLGGTVRHFEAKDVSFAAFDPGPAYRFFSWLLDPQIAYMLLLLGVAGLFFELITPGVILPGVVGGLSLLLALYALTVLPTNAAGLLLVLFGAGLFLLEIHVTSYGLLSVAGVASLFMGSLLLFRSEGQGGLPLGVILPTVVGVSLLLLGGVWLLSRAQRLRPRSGLAALVGQTAAVRHWEGPSGKVFVRGELWNAVAASGLSRDFRPGPGQTVVIVAVSGMTLTVAPPPSSQP